MPKRPHLSLVDGSVDAWNAERRRFRELGTAGEPEDLFDVDLSGVSLRGRDLSSADLSDCSLVGADLREARLSWVNLSRSDLRDADLRDATVVAANLSHVQLQGAQLHGATFGDTLLVRCNLAVARGLLQAVHRFDSVVDVQTLLRTAAADPASAQRAAAARFLRGAGVPKHLLVAVGFGADEFEASNAGSQVAALPVNNGLR